jgi:hypothetical protein
MKSCLFAGALVLSLCLASSASAFASPNPLTATYPNARALAQALRDSVGSKAAIVFWPNTPHEGKGQHEEELWGQYLPPTLAQLNCGQTSGTICLSTKTVNALIRIVQHRARADDRICGLICVLHEANHSIGKCRFVGPQTDAESDVEELWAQRQAEVLLAKMETFK